MNSPTVGNRLGVSPFNWSPSRFTKKTRFRESSPIPSREEEGWSPICPVRLWVVSQMRRAVARMVVMAAVVKGVGAAGRGWERGGLLLLVVGVVLLLLVLLPRLLRRATRLREEEAEEEEEAGE